MSESVRQDLPGRAPAERLEIQTTEDEALVIRKAAKLVGWTVPEYVMCAVLDRAERDLYEHAASERADPPFASRDEAAEPFVAVVTALG